MTILHDFLIYTSQFVGLKFKIQICTQNRRPHDIKTTNKPLEYAAKLKCLGTTVTHQNYIHEDVKSRLTWNVLPFCL
jgi:hypothetical protein